MQVFELASCLFLQAQSSSPTSAPAAICSISTHFFRATPLFSLKRLAFFKSRPQECYFALSTTPSQITETARTAGSCDRRGARTTPRLCPASPLAASPSAESRLQASFFCVCRVRNAPVQRRNVRSSGFRRVHARLCPESRTNCRHWRDRLGLALWLCVQPVFSIKSAYFLLAASSSSCCICRSYSC